MADEEKRSKKRKRVRQKGAKNDAPRDANDEIHLDEAASLDEVKLAKMKKGCSGLEKQEHSKAKKVGWGGRTQPPS